VVALAVLASLARSGVAFAYCDPHRTVEVGKLPDIIFPPGRPACAAIIPLLVKYKEISDASASSCGVYPRVRNGYPHVGVSGLYVSPGACNPANFSQFFFEIGSGGSSILEQTAYTGQPLGVYSDGTPGSGTIEFVSTMDELFDTHLPGSRNYVIGTLNYFVPSSSSTSATDTAFTQTVSSTNIGHLGTSTVLSFPLADNQPSVKLHVTVAWGYGMASWGVYNNHPIAAAYGYDVPNQWSIVNKDGGAMPIGAQFNVEIASPTDDAAFTSPQAMSYQNAFLTPTPMDHDVQALMFPTASNLPNPSPIGMWYNSVLSAWEIFGEGGAHLNGGATYVTRGVGSADLGSYVYNQQGGSISGNLLWLRYDSNVNTFSRLFIANTNAGPIPSNIGIKWIEPYWVAYRQDQQAMPTNASLNVYMHHPAVIAAPTRGDSTGDRLADIMLIGGTLNSIPVAYSFGNGAFGSTNLLRDANFPTWARQTGAKVIAGDFDGDGRTDVALTGGTGWSMIPVAFANGDGTFRDTSGGVTANTVLPPVAVLPSDTGDTGFAWYATLPGATPVAGDFNGDGIADIALTGGSGWGTIPVAYSRGDGTFIDTNAGITGGDTNFPWYATLSGARPVAGDFDGDGIGDVLLTCGDGWGTLPVAFGNGNYTGGFHATNSGVTSGDTGFPFYASSGGVIPLAGDFNGDGKGDVALVHGPGWSSIPIAFSNGDGTFWGANVINSANAGFASLSTAAGAKAVTGDFNGDGRTDIALTGGPWSYIPVAFSNGDGTFYVTTYTSSDFPGLASSSGATPVSAY
jgi:hypothetical protein